MIVVGVRTLDPHWLRHGLNADLHRTPEERQAYRERLRRLWEAIEQQEEDLIGCVGTKNPREQVKERIADLNRRIDKIQARYEEAHLSGAGEDELFKLAAKLSSLRTQRSQWKGWMNAHAWKHPKKELETA